MIRNIEDDIRTGCLARTGMEPAELSMQFASFGNDCEFGFVQRHFGAEPISIFRWANPKADMILHGLRTNFADLGEDLAVELDRQQPRREWIIVDRFYALRQHTFIFEGDPKEENIEVNIRRHLAFLRRQLQEDIALGEKIFVIKSAPNVPEQTARTIALALRELGPGWLLWVVDEPGGPAVERVQDGLLKARVNGLLWEGHPRWFEMQCAWAQWLEAMMQAWQLVNQDR
ncbi:hypothetical protein [Sphingomonas sp. dw_22]|uniref:hypothetical protein n=1 Tax=Sphingomonas sp. dw_22 TaxID=2721175 RepID=UPI001BD2CB1A|nr:hypothetical protein [Sphingomonas sp. dw_22]